MHAPRSYRYFIIILAAGTILRCADLTGESIWVDEGRSMALAKMSVSDIIEQNALDNHPPFYYLFLHFWIRIFGTGEISGRMPAVLLGIASIIMLFRVGRKLFTEKIALYASLIFALSVFHVQYAQEIKTYAPATFFTLVSFYAFLHLQERVRMYYVLVYGFSTLILLYTHFLAIPVVIAQNILFAVAYIRTGDVRRLRSWLMIQTGVLALFFPWLPFLFARTADLPGSFWLPPVDLSEIPKTLLIYSGTYTFFGIASLAIFTILIVTAVYKPDDQSRQLTVLLVWLVTPVAIPLLISFLYAPIYIARITIAASLPFYLLAGCGLQRIADRSVRSQILLYLIILSSGNLLTYYAETNKERWREAVDLIEHSAEQNDLIIVHPGFCIENAIDFYRQRNDLNIMPFPEDRLEILPADLESLDQAITPFDRIWLIRSHSRDTTDAIPALLRSRFRPEKLVRLYSRSFNSHQSYNGVELWRWQRVNNNRIPIMPEVYH